MNRRAPLFADITIAIFVIVVFFTLIALGGGCTRATPIATYPSETGCTFDLLDVRTVEVEP